MSDLYKTVTDKYSAEFIGIKDEVLIELWKDIQPNIATPGVVTSVFTAATRAFEARLGVLQHEAIVEANKIMVRNEQSSNRMLCASYIMIGMATLQVIATIVQMMIS